MTQAPAPNHIPDYVSAAHGDPDACYRLSLAARAAVLDGSDDALTGSMEGATLARLAAIRGNISAAALMSQHLSTVASLYEEAGDSSHAEQYCAESLAVLELTEAHTPPGWDAAAWSDHILSLVTETASKTDPHFMALTKAYRAVWAPFLDPPIQIHRTGDAQR